MRSPRKHAPDLRAGERVFRYPLGMTTPEDRELAAAERRHIWDIVSEQLSESLAPLVASYWKNLVIQGVPEDTADYLAAELQTRLLERFRSKP